MFQADSTPCVYEMICIVCLGKIVFSTELCCTSFFLNVVTLCGWSDQHQVIQEKRELDKQAFLFLASLSRQEPGICQKLVCIHRSVSLWTCLHIHTETLAISCYFCLICNMSAQQSFCSVPWLCHTYVIHISIRCSTFLNDLVWICPFSFVV